MNTEAKKVRVSIHERVYHYICPKCGRPIEQQNRATKSLCLRCGQRLDWKGTDEQICEMVIAEDSSEALCIAEKYFEINQMNEKDWFDLESWRKSLKSETRLCLIFENQRNHGVFMRWAGKEGVRIIQ